MSPRVYTSWSGHKSDIRGEVYSATELIEHYLEAELTLVRLDWRENAEKVPQLHLAQFGNVRHVEVYFYNAIGTLLESSTSGGTHAPTAPLWFVWLVQWSFEPIPDVRRFVDFDAFAVGALAVPSAER